MRRVFEKLDNAKADKMYVTEEMSLREISQLLKVSYKSLVDYLHYKEINIREPKRREKLREKPPVGSKFGNWTVVSEELKSGNVLFPGSKNRTLYWNVQCDCGYIGWRNPYHLKTGKSTCCKKCGRTGNYEYGEPHTVAGLIKSKLRQIAYNASLRKKVSKLDFTIQASDIQSLYDTQKAQCCLSGLDISLDHTKSLQEQMMSIDRIDSNVGYIPSNIQLVDKRINMMKGTLSNEEFIMLCTAVADYNRNRN